MNKYFSVPNLQLAWERLVRSSARDVKDYFGIEVYGANLGKNLEELSKALIEGNYSPSRPLKFFEPKASGTQRTKSLLVIEDALVYQSIANIIGAENYDRFQENEDFVFGSVLHEEVKEGIDVLNNENAQLYFYQFYMPYYLKFINSVNHEIDNLDINYKFETDITGFFDCIPHSKLFAQMSAFGVPEDILILLQKCLNIWSGTRESPTPGVGIPQGPQASFLLANLLLYPLDEQVTSQGYTYYRYMDDIRIFATTENELRVALIKIDEFLKGLGLSLNSKKTSISPITDRDAEKVDFKTSASGYEALFSDSEISELLKATEAKDILISAGLIKKDNTDILVNDFPKTDDESSGQEGDGGDEQFKYKFKRMSNEEVIAHCLEEKEDTEKVIFKLFDLKKKSPVLKDEDWNEDIVSELRHQAWRYRSLFRSLRYIDEVDAAKPNPKLIPVWLLLVDKIYWKGDQFAWLLNLHGANDQIKNNLLKELEKSPYEWLRHKIISNLNVVQKFKLHELKELYRNMLEYEQNSPFVRWAYYKLLLFHVQPDQQLYATVVKSIKREPDPYIKSTLFYDLAKKKDNSFTHYELLKMLDL